MCTKLFLLLICLLGIIKVSNQSYDTYSHEIIFPSNQYQQTRRPAYFSNDFVSTSSSLNDDEPASFLQFSAAGQYRPTLTAVNLFTPNTVQQPAETIGQVQNYKRALQEIAREDAEEEARIRNHFNGLLHYTAGRGQGPSNLSGVKSYVDVRVTGGKGYSYGYSV